MIKKDNGDNGGTTFLSRKMRKGRKSCLKGHAESAEIRRKGLLLNVFLSVTPSGFSVGVVACRGFASLHPCLKSFVPSGLD